jgi:formamidopyrimidine-DNA glycosylase
MFCTLPIILGKKEKETLMPELPDVEIFKQYLDATALHKNIETVDLRDKDMLKGVSQRKLTQRLKNTCLRSSRRHGKYLFAQADDNGWLLLHFGMTGSLKYFKDPEKDTDHDRLCLGFSNGYYLAFDCQRKLGEIGWLEDPRTFVQERGMGPDAMDADLDLDSFKKIFSRSRGSVKGALMNQDMIAGVGNVYADEILFQAGIHPKTKVSQLGAERFERLFRVMREQVLPTAIECRADPSEFPDDFIVPHRGKDGRCPKCGQKLKQIRVSGRTSYLCPDCQSM